MNLKKRLGDNLVAIRNNLGLTQEDLAKVSKINKTTIGYIENCRVSISIDLLQKLSIALDTDPCLLIARNTLVIPKTKIKSLQLIPTLLKKGEVAFAFWTEEGMEFHPLAKNTVRTSITMMALLQANGFSGEDLFKSAKKCTSPTYRNSITDPNCHICTWTLWQIGVPNCHKSIILWYNN